MFSGNCFVCASPLSASGSWVSLQEVCEVQVILCYTGELKDWQSHICTLWRAGPLHACALLLAPCPMKQLHRPANVCVSRKLVSEPSVKHHAISPSAVQVSYGVNAIAKSAVQTPRRSLLLPEGIVAHPLGQKCAVMPPSDGMTAVPTHARSCRHMMAWPLHNLDLSCWLHSA